MKNKSIILVLIIILFEMVSYIFKDILNNSIYFINTLFWVIIAIVSYIRIGSLRYKRRTKIDTIQLIIIVDLLYLFISYIIGLFKGFNDNNINILLIIYRFVTLISIELSRYSLIKNISNKYRYLISFLFVIPILLILNINVYLSFAILISSILLTYITYNVGIIPSIINNLLLYLFYLIPVSPNIDIILNTIIILIVNIILFILLNNLYKKDLANLNFIRKKESKIIYLLLIILIPYICLLIGIGHYKLIGIVSDSMKPVFSRGAGIVYKKIDDTYYDKLQVGDILVYEKDNTLVVHRVIKKDNGLVITKGDNMSESDIDPVTMSQYRGVVKIYIPLIGYPNVWLSE